MGLLENIGANTSAILTTKPTAKFVSGARCVLRINKRLVGFAFGISWNINTMVDEIYGIDDYLPQDMAPNKISVIGTISMLHIPGRGPSAEYLQPHILSFLFQKYISIEVRDSATNNLLLYVPKALVVTRAEDIRVENLAQVVLQWKAIGWQDEIQPEVPPDTDATDEELSRDEVSGPKRQ